MTARHCVTDGGGRGKEVKGGVGRRLGRSHIIITTPWDPEYIMLRIGVPVYPKYIHSIAYSYGFLLVDLLAGLFVHWFVVTAANTRFQIDLHLDVYPNVILLTILWFFDCATAATFNVWLISMLMNSMDCLINMHLNIYCWLGAYLSLRNLLPSLTVTSFLGSAVYSRIFSAVVSSEQLVWWPTLIKALLLFSDLFRMKFNPLQIQTLEWF